jgi:hypothetical protein
VNLPQVFLLRFIPCLLGLLASSGFGSEGVSGTVE